MPSHVSRWALATLLATTVVSLGSAGCKRNRIVRRHHKGGRINAVASASAVASQLAKLPTAPPAMALEVWIKDPEAVAEKLIPRFMKLQGIPAPPTKLLLPSLSKLLTNGLPPEKARNLEQLDTTQPFGYIVLDTPAGAPATADGGSRFVLAASAKDAKTGQTYVDDYASQEGAIKEICPLGGGRQINCYKGKNTGRYLAYLDGRVLLSTDKEAIAESAPRVAAGIEAAKTQSHLIVARAPKSWIYGPFKRGIESAWVNWVGPQLGGATTGPAKTFFDDIATSAQGTFPGVGDLEIFVDATDDQATATVTLLADAGTPFAKFLAAYPTEAPATILQAPRDALAAAAFRFPLPWLEVIRKFLTTPPPGVEIPAELKAKTEAAFTDFQSALTGEVVIANLADPPPGGPGTNVLRFGVKDLASAKKAAKGLVDFLIPDKLPRTPITGDDGASGEVVEIPVDVPQGAPPGTKLPPIGLGWVVKGNYLYVARGSNPKERALAFATGKPETVLGADAMVKARIATMPASAAFISVVAPFRADTPIAAALKQPPLPEAISIAVEPSQNALVVHAKFDIELTFAVLAPMLLAPQRGPGGPGGPGGQPGMAMPPGMGMQPGMPGTMGGPTGSAAPPVMVPSAPSGATLDIPTRRHTDY
jgi:hypothetical protein